MLEHLLAVLLLYPKGFRKSMSNKNDNNLKMRGNMEIFKVLLFSGFFVLMGVLVWKKNRVDFLAGYKKNAINNPKKLAKKLA